MYLYCLVVICFIFPEFVDLDLRVVTMFCVGVAGELCNHKSLQKKTCFVASRLALHEKLLLFGQSEVEMLDGKVVL